MLELDSLLQIALMLHVADFVWTTENNTENFEIIGRFSGKVPGGLDYKICPTLK